MVQLPVIETPRMSLWIHPDERIVHHQMHQYPGQETLQCVLLKGLDLLKEYGATKWLSDDRAGGALPKSHHEWGDQVWAPRAVAAGWKYWALLPPAQALGHANMTRLVEVYAKQGVTVEIFADVNKAFLWLRRQTDSRRPSTFPGPVSDHSKETGSSEPPASGSIRASELGSDIDNLRAVKSS